MSPENVAMYAMIARLREAVRHNDRDVRDFLESVLTEWTELRGREAERLRDVSMCKAIQPLTETGEPAVPEGSIWKATRGDWRVIVDSVIDDIVAFRVLDVKGDSGLCMMVGEFVTAYTCQSWPVADLVAAVSETPEVAANAEPTPEYSQCVSCHSRIAVERDKRGHRMTMCGPCRSARSRKANAAKDTAPPPTDTPAEVVCCKCGCNLPGERNKVGQLVTTCAACQSAQGRAAAMQSAKVRAERKQAAADAAGRVDMPGSSDLQRDIDSILQSSQWREDEVRRRLGAIMEQLGACEVEDLTRVSAAVKVPIHRVRAIHGELADDRRKKLGNGGRLPERGDPAPVGMETLP